jgi:DNA-binding transcriptional regulator YhcF (GntR family)
VKKDQFIQHFIFDELSATPKYQQVVDNILRGIQQGVFKKGDMLPSINDISLNFDISRITVEKGYNELRKKDVIDSIPGKGYFILNASIKQNLRIFLMFNKLSAHKKLIYDAFVETLGDKAAIDFYVYNNDYKLFNKLLQQQRGHYTHHVIIPHFTEGETNAYTLINQLPKEKLILLDKKIKDITGDYGAVYENFEKDIYTALTAALDPLSKYQRLKLIFPENSYFPKEIVDGFENFCLNYAFSHKIVKNIALEPIEKGEVYINLMEDDLAILLSKIIDLNLTVGKDVGLISYNETPLKKYIMTGLTTISTDFKAMGESAAHLVLNNAKTHIENPFFLILRGSL